MGEKFDRSNKISPGLSIHRRPISSLSDADIVALTSKKIVALAAGYRVLIGVSILLPVVQLQLPTCEHTMFAGYDIAFLSVEEGATVGKWTQI
jgi:hypothetical protein